MKTTLKLLITILFLFSFISGSADTYPKRELRSTWLATVYALDWPKTTNKATTSSGVSTQKSELRALLDGLKAAGFNAVSFQVRSMCDAMYKSSYEPWSSYLTGTRGETPYGSFDPLAYCVEQAHARGMECHAWINPFRFASGTGSSYTTERDNYYRKEGMLMTNTVESTWNGETTSSTVTILNPALQSVRQRITDICAEIATNYDIDGIMFDDYFYNPEYIPETSKATDWTHYQSYKSSGGTMDMDDWRRDNINKTLKQVYDKLQTIKKGTIRFGLGPAGIGGGSNGATSTNDPHPDIPNLHQAPYNIKTLDSQYGKIYSDPVAWLKGGYIDYISPQVYWKIDNENHSYDGLTHWWSDVAHQFGRHCYVSQTISGFATTYEYNNDGSIKKTIKNNTTENWEERVQQAKLNRQYNHDNAPGSVYYSTAYISGHKYTGFGDYLKENLYQYKSLPPEISWKSLDDPGKVTGLKRSGTTLSWNDLSSDVRYTVYAVPLTVNPKDAASTVHDGIKAEYLLGFTYGNTYTLEDNQTSGHWYAVAPFDRLCKEWEATTLNAPATDPVNIALTSPENGTQSGATTQIFNWTGDDGATFNFQISSDAYFSSIIHNEETTDKSVTFSTETLNDATTYFWRVIASRNGYITTTSEVWSFMVPVRPTAQVSLTTPADGETLTELPYTLSWTGEEGAQFNLEVSIDETFGDPAISNYTNSTIYELLPNILNPATTYYWRVKASKTDYKTGVSEVWSFTTPDIPTWTIPDVYKPDDEVDVDRDLSFVVKDTEADVTELQISKTPDFSTYYYKGNNRWYPADDEKGETWLQYTLPITTFTNGTYYWRVLVKKADYKDGYTETRWFTVSGQSDVGAGYSMIHEDLDYPIQNVEGSNQTLTNIWVRSDSHANGLGQSGYGTNNRGFCARKTDNILYVSGRDGEKNAYLDKYNAATGEYIGQLTLSGSFLTNYQPCNGVGLDSNDNVFIYNMALDGTGYPFQICSVNPTTGEVTQEVKIANNDALRYDHCAVVGDVTSNFFYVLAASNTQNGHVYRWTVTNGTVNKTEKMAISSSSFYPTTSTPLGAAPRVIPVDESNFYLDGSNVTFSLFEFGSGTAKGSFAQNTTLTPKSINANGGAYFTHDGVPYVVYPSEDFTGADGYKFIIASDTNQPGAFSYLKKRYTIPQENIGNGKNTGGDYGALVGIIQRSALSRSANSDVTNIYLYVPGNGMAMYTLRSRIVTDSEEISIEEIKPNVMLNDGIIEFGAIIDKAHLYSTSGNTIATAQSTTCMEAPAQRGIYILVLNLNEKIFTQKIIIK